MDAKVRAYLETAIEAGLQQIPLTAAMATGLMEAYDRDVRQWRDQFYRSADAREREQKEARKTIAELKQKISELEANP